MRKIVKQLLFFVILIIGFGVQAQIISTTFPASDKETAQLIANDFKKYAEDIFLPVATAEEKLIAKDIQYLYVNTIPFAHVGASIENGRRLVGINVGTYVRLVLLSEAFFLSAVDQNSAFFDGYLTYLAFADLLGPKIINPREYAKFYGLDGMVSKAETLSTDEKLRIEGIFHNLIAHFIGHEIAHHVLGHLAAEDQTKEAVRLREVAADKWATERMVQGGGNPIFASITMRMFNELENRSLISRKSSTHPPSMERAVNIAEVTISALEQEKKNFILRNGGGEVVFDFAMRLSKALRAAIQKEKFEQDYMDNATLKDFRLRAEKGGRYYQIKMGDLLLPKEKNPENPGFIDQAATDQVIFWYKKAAENPAKFDYFYSAVADYQLGAMLAFRKGVARDDALSCKHLKRAAEMGYIPAVHSYETMQKAGRCK